MSDLNRREPVSPGPDEVVTLIVKHRVKAGFEVPYEAWLRNIVKVAAQNVGHLGVDVVRPKVTETTALGAAYLAGLAVGYWSSTDDVQGQWQLDQRFKPALPAEEVQTSSQKVGGGTAVQLDQQAGVVALGEGVGRRAWLGVAVDGDRGVDGRQERGGGDPLHPGARDVERDLTAIWRRVGLLDRGAQ